MTHDGSIELDVGVIPLPRNAMVVFDGCSPIDESEINESYTVDHSIGRNSIFVMGYSASRSQFRVNHVDKAIKQSSLQFTGLAESQEIYDREAMSSGHHLIVEFGSVRSGAQPAVPPTLQGVSGGGMFHLVTRDVDATVRLVALATEHRRSVELIVGTRIEHFLKLAREMK